MRLSKTSLSFRVYIPRFPGVPSTEQLYSMHNYPLLFLLCTCKWAKLVKIILESFFTNFSVTKKKKKPLPKPSWKATSEMFCSPSKPIRLSVEHEPSANTHPAVISTLSHFAFVKFCIPALYESELYCGREMMFRTQIYFCVCVWGEGVDSHWSRTVWKWRTELWIM